VHELSFDLTRFLSEFTQHWPYLYSNWSRNSLKTFSVLVLRLLSWSHHRCQLRTNTHVCYGSEGCVLTLRDYVFTTSMIIDVYLQLWPSCLSVNAEW